MTTDRYTLADFADDGHLPECSPSLCDAGCADVLGPIARDLQDRIDAVRAEALRAQDGRGSWVHATRLLALTDDDPAQRPTTG